MIRVFWTVLFGYLYAFISIPTLLRVRKLQKDMDPVTLDAQIFAFPKKWARSIFRKSGSTIDVIGQEKMPDGPVLMVANHQGNFDILSMLGFVEKPAGFVSKIEMRKLPVIRNWMEAMHNVFMDREDKRQSVKAFSMAIDNLKKGHSMIIFPEGTRSKDLQLQEFKSGSLRLAVKPKVPVVPVAIQGTREVMEANGGKIKPGHIRITICDPIFPEDYEGLSLDEVTAETKSRIQQVIGENETVEELVKA